MKTIYKINRVIIIINLFLFLTVYLGMLFLPVTGIIQIACFIFYLRHWDRLAPYLKKHLKVYATTAILTLLLLFPYLREISDAMIWISICSGSILALYFLIISYVQKSYYESKILL